MESQAVKPEEAGVAPRGILSDAAEQAALLPWLPIEYRQMSAGRYAGHFEELALGDIGAVEEWQSQRVQKTGVMAPNCCTVSVMCGTFRHARFSQFANISDSHVYLLPTGSEFDAQVPADHRTLFVRVPQETLLAEARALDERAWETPPRNLMAFATLQRGSFIATLDTLFDLLRAHGGELDRARARRALLDSMLFALNDACKIMHGDDPGLHARRRVLHVVSRAREYTEARLMGCEVPSLAEICTHTRVSERTLQYSFREHLGMAPVSYLRIARLHRARRELCRPRSATVGVTEVAMRWGFLHLGAFARDYRLMFGERPSETLARTLPPRRPAGADFQAGQPSQRAISVARLPTPNLR